MPEPSLDWLAIINLLGIVQGLFLSIVFFTIKKGNKTANHLLGFSLFNIAFIVFEIFLGYTGYIQFTPLLVNLEEPMVFLIGPLTYLYTLSLLKDDFRFQWKVHGIHFIPALLQFAGRLPFYLQSNAFKVQDTAKAFHKPILEKIPAEKILYFPEFEFLVGEWLDVVCISLIIAYELYSFWLIFQHAQKLKIPFWKLGKPSLRWLTRMQLLFFVFLLVASFFSFAMDDDLGDIYIATSCSLIFYSISFYLIFHLQDENEEDTLKKYERSTLDPSMIRDIKFKLENIILNDQVYLDSELTLPLLADKVKVSVHHLSQVINEQYHLNFSDYINRFRIEEMKKRLLDKAYSHLKIEQIAFDTGFNSKSTFQTAFKKFTGITPSQFRKIHSTPNIKQA